MSKIISFISNYRASLLLLLISLIFRLAYGSHYVVFSQDVARDNLIIQKYINNHTYLVGYGPKASVYDFYLPPFYYQLHLIVSLITHSYPLVMKYLITIVESITPVILFLILSRILSQWKAYLLAILYLLSSLVLSISVNAWNPNMIPFFSTLALYTWIKIFIDKKYKWFILGVLATTLAIQLHYQAVVLISFLVFISTWSLIKNKYSLKYILIGLTLSSLTMLPYVFAELNNGWHNTHQIINYFTQEHSRYFDQVSKINFFSDFIPSFLQRVLMGYHYNLLIGRLIFVFGLLFVLFNMTKKDRLAILMGIYMFSILIMLRVYKGDKLDYYMSTLFIVPPILIAFIWKYIKTPIFSIFIFVLIYYSGLYLGKSGNFNDLKTINSEQQLISQISSKKQFRVLFHNDDQINKYAYIFNNLSKTSNDSNYVLEVCESTSQCEPASRPICVNNMGYTYANILRTTQTNSLLFYNLQSRFILSQYQDTIKPLGYKLYEYDNAYGIDTVFPQAYNWY